ncbi:GAF domain-containing SpoIIE family protein phosphatase [Nocardioides sp. CER19]|uniref:PP2C family protein-serine/threonine phosphatase n=1 Tax=Nocardioides sp. CER19 TaxID=3038538 RepID=UPI002446F073|nr:GAF domain-containing SpoIIE family protein phosphatase [Nocardioides sp. CER19]MDH2414921.1 SpoIIE family protein phosphatase [Nocardioides sp. CER19]
MSPYDALAVVPVIAHAVAPGDSAETYPGLSSLLDRVRSTMRADTATVLVLDRTRTLLEPAATVGLDRTLRRARRVPLGEGFAGRVAQTRQPVSLTHVDRSTVLNPVLLDHGVRSLLGVPVMDGSELLGVLHVGFLQRHDATDAETRALTEFAAELGAVLHDRFVDAAHTAALTLQRSLLPTAVSAPSGISIAARYVPADGELGGDWYDVFTLPDGRLGVVMGDVVGHGLDAAIVMGRLRSALRAYALDHDDPAEVLSRLDRKICHFEAGALATVSFGVSAAPFTTWRFSSAGHYPPLVGTPGEPATVADVPSDRLLGVSPDAARRSTVLTVPPGGSLCLYTDGLVERRPAADALFTDAVADNTARLATALMDAGDPEMACIRALSDVVGDHIAEDDIAVLVAHVDAV